VKATTHQADPGSFLGPFVLHCFTCHPVLAEIARHEGIAPDLGPERTESPGPEPWSLDLTPEHVRLGWGHTKPTR
jgi:hypothetical protein